MMRPEGSVFILILDDFIHEPDEAFLVSIVFADQPWEIGPNCTTTVVINDDGKLCGIATTACEILTHL